MKKQKPKNQANLKSKWKAEKQMKQQKTKKSNENAKTNRIQSNKMAHEKAKAKNANQRTKYTCKTTKQAYSHLQTTLQKTNEPQQMNKP